MDSDHGKRGLSCSIAGVSPSLGSSCSRNSRYPKGSRPFRLAVSIILKHSALASAPFEVSQNRKFLRDITLSKFLDNVMARKNFLFADTIEGAKATSMWFSLIISARMNHLDAEKYLIYVLDQLSASETITDELVERCLPYSEQLPASLKM